MSVFGNSASRVKGPAYTAVDVAGTAISERP